MNILFLCTYKPTRNASGGIARVTINLGNLFTSHGHSCSVAYYYSVRGEEDSCFKKSVKLDRNNEKEELERLAPISDVFIVQVQMSKSYLYLLDILDSIRKKYGTKIVYCHHTKPFAEVSGSDLYYLKHLLFHSRIGLKRRITESVECLFSLLFPRLAIKRIAGRRQQVVDKTDCTVLLSEQFIPSLTRYVKADRSILAGIANCITFTDNTTLSLPEEKEKSILIVSNMTERAKRISVALRIWKKLNSKEDISDWKLILVGDGEDLDYYKKLARRLKLRNCVFTGRQDPLDYYRNSRILMLTSAYEGFPMVILEAQQMGCVPVVFDSYESVRDLITDNENGIIIPYRDCNAFADRLYGLMKDEIRWKRMSGQSQSDVSRFSPENIYNDWKKLFKRIGVD